MPSEISGTEISYNYNLWIWVLKSWLQSLTPHWYCQGWVQYNSISLFLFKYKSHHNDVMMSAIASQITSFTSVYSTVYSRRRFDDVIMTLAKVSSYDVYLLLSSPRGFSTPTSRHQFIPYQNWSHVMPCSSHMIPVGFRVLCLGMR